MAASYAQLGDIAGQPEFRRRVNVGMSTAATAIYNEASTVTGHVARAAYATKVTNGNFNLDAAVWLVLSDPTVQSNAVTNVPGNGITDAAIENAISADWNCMAGA